MELHSSPPSGCYASRGTDPLGGTDRYYVKGIFEEMKDCVGTMDWLGKDTTPHGHTTSTDEVTAGVGTLPGDRTATISAAPRDVFEVLCNFFSEVVPSIVEKRTEDFEISAMAFLDYVATDVEVSMIADGADAGVALKFRHPSQNNVVSFGQLWSKAINYVSKQLPVTLSKGFTGPSCAVLDDGWDDFDIPDDFEEDWNTCIESALQAAASSDKSVRLQGLQSLATWAATRPHSCPTIATSLAAQQPMVAGLLQAPADELYPLAVALKLSSSQEDAALEGIRQIIAPLLSSDLPTIIANELKETCKNLKRDGERASSKAMCEQVVLATEPYKSEAPSCCQGTSLAKRCARIATSADHASCRRLLNPERIGEQASSMGSLPALF